MPMGRISRHRRCAWWAILDEKRDLHAEISLPETRPRRNTRYMACAVRGFRILALKLRAKGDSHPEKRLRRPEPPVQGPAQAQNLAPRPLELAAIVWLKLVSDGVAGRCRPRRCRLCRWRRRLDARRLGRHGVQRVRHLGLPVGRGTQAYFPRNSFSNSSRQDFSSLNSPSLLRAWR